MYSGVILMKLLIFTDLDGTMLNHDDYSYRDALPAIDRIRKSGISLILTTSKTRKEVELLRNEMGIYDPFIVENGAAIYFPNEYRKFIIEDTRHESPFLVIQLGLSYDRIRSFINEVREQYNIRGFGDMSVDEIAHLTGLSREQAEFAGSREYTEPFIMDPDQDIDTLQDLAVEKDIKVTKGGRFYHMIGLNQDKGEAVKIIRDIFDRKERKRHLTIGIGDSINDVPMLDNVDIPVLIPHPYKGHINYYFPCLIKANKPGAQGWNEIIVRLLDEHTTNNN